MPGKSCEIFLRRSFSMATASVLSSAKAADVPGSAETPDKNVRAGSAAVDRPETEAAAVEGCEEAEVV